MASMASMHNSMNFIGGIGILDRGDAPAQEVLDRNARSHAQRVSNETKEELTQVMKRVDNIYEGFDLQETLKENNRLANTEYVSDVMELEEILKDNLKKKQYQQQVTIFIVGYENACVQKLKLLQQVNEFFVENTKDDDDVDVYAAEPEIDLDEVATSIEESLQYTEQLAHKLGDINSDIVEYLTNYAQAKASNKGKKKLEKALYQAKEDIGNISEKLLHTQREIEEKEEKIQQLYRQTEMKNMEIQRLKLAADAAKKSMEETEGLKTELGNRDNLIRELRTKVDQLTIEMDSMETAREELLSRLKNDGEDNGGKIEDLQREMERQYLEAENAKKDLIRYHEDQTIQMSKSHQQKMDELEEEHALEMKHFKDKVKDLTEQLEDEKRKNSTNLSDTKSDSRPNTKDSKSKKKGKGTASDNEEEEDAEKSRPSSHKCLEQVKEEVVAFDYSYDLDAEEMWADLPPNHVLGRFTQFRELARARISELEEQLSDTIQKTQRKVNTLKGQFQEHKSKWESERNVLIEQIDQSQKLQNVAEKEADVAMAQLEDFINEQEELEIAEEEKCKSRASATPAPPVVTTPDVGEQPESLQEVTEEPEGEKLLEQTDDAKGKHGKMTPSSRETIRSKYRESLEETRSAIAERRSKSPALSFKSMKSSLDDMELDENGDMPFPEDKTFADIGTSPMTQKDDGTPSSSVLRRPLSLQSHSAPSMIPAANENIRSQSAESSLTYGTRTNTLRTTPYNNHTTTLASTPDLYHAKTPTLDEFAPDDHGKSLTLAEHPVVQEYLKTYDTVMAFKDTLGKILAKKDMTSAGQLLTEMEPYAFNMAEKVQPQVEEMTRNVVQIFEEMLQLLSGVILSKGPYSIDGAPERSFLTKTDTGLAPSRISRHSNDSIGDIKMAAQIKDLQEQLMKLEMMMGSQKQQYEEKLNHNTVVMMEMQDTINGLRREMSNIGIQTRAPSTAPLQPVGSPIMFTRLDSERNSKVMKKAVMTKKLETNKYQAAVEKMDEYVNIPAQRLAHLIRKYTHHCQMKAIEANVRLSRSLNDEVFHILDKMEQLQNRRAQKWAEKMDVMGSERLRLAQLLMEVLDDIEMESGIFLIKPMYSYKGREYLNLYANRQSRAHTQKFRTVSPLPAGRTNASSRALGVAPAPTPASQLKHDREMENMMREEVGKMYTHKTDDGISGASLGWVTGERTGGMWSASMSQSKALTEDNLLFQSSILNTPRILELDVNRMMIGQNQISAKMRGSLGDDRLMNASQTNLRNYVTVTRPTNSTTHKKDRPKSGSTTVPPTTPYMDRKESGDDPRATLPRDTVPLPPISPTILKEKTGTKVKFEPPVPPDPSQ